MYAIIDIGSNTIRLNVYQVEEDGAIHSIFQSKETAGLAGYVAGGRLHEPGGPRPGRRCPAPLPVHPGCPPH